VYAEKEADQLFFNITDHFSNLRSLKFSFSTESPSAVAHALMKLKSLKTLSIKGSDAFDLISLRSILNLRFLKSVFVGKTNFSYLDGANQISGVINGIPYLYIPKDSNISMAIGNLTRIYIDTLKPEKSVHLKKLNTLVQFVVFNESVSINPPMRFQRSCSIFIGSNQRQNVDFPSIGPYVFTFMFPIDLYNKKYICRVNINHISKKLGVINIQNSQSVDIAKFQYMSEHHSALSINPNENVVPILICVILIHEFINEKWA